MTISKYNLGFLRILQDQKVGRLSAFFTADWRKLNLLSGTKVKKTCFYQRFGLFFEDILFSEEISLSNFWLFKDHIQIQRQAENSEKVQFHLCT